MSLATSYTRACQGIDAAEVSVESHLANGLPAFSIVGLAEAAVRESRDRVRAAIVNSQFDFPQKRITVNLAPADLPKTGGLYDLSIAIGILAASGQLPVEALIEYEWVGELALSGVLRGGRGVLPMALAARRAGRKLVVPQACVAEACLVDGLEVYGANHLLEVCAHLLGHERLMQYWEKPQGQPPTENDLSQVRGQYQARRALEIAAAGGHNLLFVGPPGTGKTLLASRLPGILPPMTEQEATETAAVYSISHQGFQQELWGVRPFRSPHHTVSGVALVGGGSVPQPGEISLAHNGVLFLDELTEFSRHALEVLREPLERGLVCISRAARQARFPARFQLIAAMNPCPCGYHGDTQRLCSCSPDQIARYRNRISGPLLDRIDMHVIVPRLKQDEIWQDRAPPAESSHEVKQRVEAAWALQCTRSGGANSVLSGAELERACDLDAEARTLLDQAMSRLGLSVRALHRVLRVSRTIADLAGEPRVGAAHIGEALGFRQLQA